MDFCVIDPNREEDFILLSDNEIVEEDESMDSIVFGKTKEEREEGDCDQEVLVPPVDNNLQYSFSYLKEEYTIMEIMKRVIPPSTINDHLNRILQVGKHNVTKTAARKWYQMWFHLCNPKSKFWDQYNACTSALDEWNEPKGFKIHRDLVKEEIMAANVIDKQRAYQAKFDAEKYGVPMKYLINRIHPDGKDRSNPKRDPEKFYYSYLMTTIETMEVDTSTKVGSSRRPICKIIYKQNEWLNSRGNRCTDPSKYKLELFIGPFVSEDASRDFNVKWKKHRGAQPRRLFAIKYAKDRNMLCLDMRSTQPSKYIDNLRKKKKAKKEISF